MSARRASLSLPSVDEARALSDPTRRRVFDTVRRAGQPLTVVEIARRSSLPAATVRPHLRVLCEVGLVSGEPEVRHVRGRPRLLYAAMPAAADDRGVDAARFQRLAQMLTSVIAAGTTPTEIGRAEGAREAERRAIDGDPVDALVDDAARNGFAPHRHAEGDGATEIELHACPYASLVQGDGDVVCGLHRGITQGFAAAVGLAVDEFSPGDDERPCRIRVRPA